jgi:hypothetical protein
MEQAEKSVRLQRSPSQKHLAVPESSHPEINIKDSFPVSIKEETMKENLETQSSSKDQLLNSLMYDDEENEIIEALGADYTNMFQG